MTYPSVTALCLVQLRSGTAGWNWPIIGFYALFTACMSLIIAVLRKAKFKPNPILFAVWALWMLWVSLSPIWFRLNTELNGVVVSAQDVPPTRGPRYATKYILRGPDGHEYEYWAGATAGSLPRSMPVGTYLKKPKWTFYYDRDGKRFDAGWGVPLVPLFAVGCLIWSIRTILREKMHVARATPGVLN